MAVLVISTMGRCGHSRSERSVRARGIVRQKDKAGAEGGTSVHNASHGQHCGLYDCRTRYNTGTIKVPRTLLSVASAPSAEIKPLSSSNSRSASSNTTRVATFIQTL